MCGTSDSVTLISSQVNYLPLFHNHIILSSRVFFQLACDVPEPEEKFNIDEYSDMVTLSKPIIYISIEEVINTHSVNSSKTSF